MRDGCVPCFLSVFEHPVGACHVDFAFLAVDELSVGHRDGGDAGVVHAACAVPGDVAVPVVALTGAGQLVFGDGEFAFDVAVGTCGFGLVVVGDFLAADDDAGAEFAVDGAGGDDADGATFVGMRDERSFDEIAFGFFGQDDLEEVAVFLEEEIAVAEADAARGFGGEHVESVAFALDGEDADAVFAISFQATELVYFGLAFGVVGELHFVVFDIHHVAFLVHGNL